jgi:hypothetical protein
VKRQPPGNYFLTPDKERRELLIWALIIVSISFMAVIAFID